MNATELIIRPADSRDASALAEIYNDAIRNTVATFDTEPKTSDERRQWLETHGERQPILVAEKGGVVVGWASLSLWSDRCAYADTGETSFYVRSENRGESVGRRLMEAIIMEARRHQYHTLIARITEGSVASLRLHDGAGFGRIGTMKEVGRKFGKLLDVHLLQMMLP
ncbi:MAG: N-acetyltransferase family protein [Verrucomicrobiota bacterium]